MTLHGNEQRTNDTERARLQEVLSTPGGHSLIRNGFIDADALRNNSFAGEPDRRGAIPEAAIRAELCRILESSIFIQSDRLGRFLRFTVEKTVAGEGEALKEYVIGTEVYGRPASYRPSEDSIVRTEARRLRHKLQEYYGSNGGNDSIYIHYRPGSYMPLFRNHPRPVVSAAATNPGEGPRSMCEQGIRIAVLPFADASGGGASSLYAQLITDELIHELVRTDGVRVTAASAVAPFVAKVVDLRSLARELDVAIVFEGTVRQDNNRLRITYRVVNGADGFHIWSERVDAEQDLQGLSRISERIASLLVSRIRPCNCRVFGPSNEPMFGNDQSL